MTADSMPTAPGTTPAPRAAGTGRRPSVFARHGGRARIGYARESVAPRFGASPSPLNAFLIGQGTETLGLRVERQSQNALAVARWLAAHDAVESVDYVGLPTHPHHETAVRYLDGGFGSIFTFTLRGVSPRPVASWRRCPSSRT